MQNLYFSFYFILFHKVNPLSIITAFQGVLEHKLITNNKVITLSKVLPLLIEKGPQQKIIFIIKLGII